MKSKEVDSIVDSDSFSETPDITLMCKGLVADLLDDLPSSKADKDEEQELDDQSDIEVDSDWEDLYLHKEVDDMFYQETVSNYPSDNQVENECYIILNELTDRAVDKSSMRMCSEIIDETLDSALSEDDCNLSSPTSVKLILKALDNLYN